MLHSLSLHPPRAGVKGSAQAGVGQSSEHRAGLPAGAQVCEQGPSHIRQSLFGLGCLVMHGHEGQKANTPQILSGKSDSMF